MLAIIAVWIGSSLITMSGFKEVSTQKGLELLQDDKVASAKIVDGEQPRRPDAHAAPTATLGSQVQFYYVTPRGADVVKAVDNANLPKGYDDEVPQPNWFALGARLPASPCC